VSAAIGNRSDISEIIVHSGQHYDENMSELFFDQLRIPRPDYKFDLEFRRHGRMTAEILGKIEDIQLEEKPDVVLVYGDTDTTLGAAIAASKLPGKLAHVEAGLRSYNFDMPEEINRRITDHCSDILFSPSSVATENLLAEGITEGKIHAVGDVMFDAVRLWSDALIRPGFMTTATSSYVLATLHRKENLENDEKLRDFVSGLVTISRDIAVIFPLHPHARNVLAERGCLDVLEKAPGINVVDPVGYFESIYLQKHAETIITDSGGMQKEALYCKTPCVTYREETEWVETIEMGVNSLARNHEQLVAQVMKGVDEESDHDWSEMPYGDGYAAEKIVRVLLENA